MARLTFRSTVRSAVEGLRPTQRLVWTREGVTYIAVWLILLLMGLHQQINLVLLIAGLAAGPIVGSIFVSASLIKGLGLDRRQPPFVFAGDELAIEYQLENRRRWSDALAMAVEQELAPVDAASPGSSALRARAFFARVPGRRVGRVSWRTSATVRGRYRFRPAELVTRSPFGLIERRLSLPLPGEVLIYPTVGTLSRRWRVLHREATEARRGRRNDRSAQQQEYHGLRDYRAGDSPRWIHWRTTARLGTPMVKEFEQQSEQDLVVLIDPWAPRPRGEGGERDVVEAAIRFVATVCLESCRNQGRRVVLGWTGATHGILHGPASTKLLHRMLEALALLRSTPEGPLAPLVDGLPPALLREALIVIVSTRRIDLAAEFRSARRLADGNSASRLAGRVVLLDASRGDLDGLVSYGRPVDATGRPAGRAPEPSTDDDRTPPPELQPTTITAEAGP